MGGWVPLPLFHPFVLFSFRLVPLVFLAPDADPKGIFLVLERKHRQHREARPIPGAQLLFEGQVNMCLVCVLCFVFLIPSTYHTYVGAHRSRSPTNGVYVPVRFLAPKH